MLQHVVDGAKERLFGLHYASISLPRADRIASAIAGLVGSVREGARMLDVGCGDGLIAKDVAAKLGGIRLTGIDVKVQPTADFEVHAYDGAHFPFADGTFDVVTLCDALHHADDPKAVLTEAFRVTSPNGVVVVKDHFSFGRWSHGVLLAMDIVGNRAQGIGVAGHYLSPTEWVAMVRDAGGVVDELIWPFHVHAPPIRLIARSEYQFLARFSKRAAVGANDEAPPSRQMKPGKAKAPRRS